MARPERAVAGRGAGEREERAGLPDATVADDHGPVVHGVLEARDEDGVEQLLRDVGIEDGSVLDEFVELRPSLEDHDGADALVRERGGGLDHFLDDGRLLRRALAPEEGPAADAHQSAADVVLEEDDDDQDEVGQDRVEDRPGGDETEPARDEIGGHEDAHADRDLHRARPLEEREHHVDQRGDEEDVEAIAEHEHRAPGEELVELRACLDEDLAEELDHESPPVTGPNAEPGPRNSASATSTAWRMISTSCTRTARAP